MAVPRIISPSLLKTPTTSSSFSRLPTHVRHSFRQFHASPITMSNVFFDLSWEGPVLNSAGDPTAEVKSKMMATPHYPPSTICNIWEGPWLTLAQSRLAASILPSTMMLSLRLPGTSVSCALASMVLAIKDQSSTVSSLVLCFKAVISLVAT